MSHDARWREPCVSRDRDSERRWLWRLVRPFEARYSIRSGHLDSKRSSHKGVKYFYALAFAGAGTLLLLYVYHFARQGEMPIRGATFERRTNAPAFWLFAILFSLIGLGALAGAVAILRSSL